VSQLTSRPPLSDEAVIDASEINARFTDFTSASTSIDANNLRDGAVDLPQYAAQQIVRSDGAFTETLGCDDWDTVTNIVTTVLTATPSPPPATPNPVVDSTLANASIVNFGLAGRTITLVDVLRVSWSLKVNLAFVGTPYDTAGSLGQFDISNFAPATITVTDGMHAVPFYLQWDITSNALANWVAVPGQTTFQTAINIPAGGVTGGKIEECSAATFFPAWVARGVGVSDGKATGDAIYARGWRTVRGSWLYTPPLGVTCYGIRVVYLPALYHPATQLVTGKAFMVYDPIASVGCTLYTQSGFITAIVQRLG
jgi:hypothetical protein